MNSKKQISINWNNNAEEWWAAARESTDVPEFLKPLMFTPTDDTVVVTRKEAKIADDWMRNLPGGWGEPLVIQGFT